MGGFLGIGGSGASTDRANILSGIQSQWGTFGTANAENANLFNQGQNFQQAGQNNLNSAAQYWNNLLTAGRTQTAKNASPAINATLDASNASKAGRAQFGTGRSGGTVSADATRDQTTQKSIDDIINQNLVGGREAGAKGLQQVGGTELATGSTAIGQALNALGIAGNAGQNVAADAAGQYQTDYKNSEEAGAALGQSIGPLLSLFGL